MRRAEAVIGPTVPRSEAAVVDPMKTQKISQWSQGRLLQRLVKMKSACFGRQSFDGPKKLALLRILQQADRRGDIIVVVLPVSPAYEKELLTPDATRAFE